MIQNAIVSGNIAGMKRNTGCGELQYANILFTCFKSGVKQLKEELL